MKQFKPGDRVAYNGLFNKLIMVEIVELYENVTPEGIQYPVALTIQRNGKSVNHSVISTEYLSHDDTEYKRLLKREKIQKEIDKLHDELDAL